VSVVVFAYHDVGCMGLRTLKRLGVEIAQVYTPRNSRTSRR